MLKPIFRIHKSHGIYFTMCGSFMISLFVIATIALAVNMQTMAIVGP